MQDLPFLLRRLLREMMDPQRTLPLVIRARVYIAVKFDIIHISSSLCLQNIVVTKAVSLHWMQMILSGVYIISPIDIIPEGDSSLFLLFLFLMNHNLYLIVFSQIFSLT